LVFVRSCATNGRRVLLALHDRALVAEATALTAPALATDEVLPPPLESRQPEAVATIHQLAYSGDDGELESSLSREWDLEFLPIPAAEALRSHDLRLLRTPLSAWSVRLQCGRYF
jgi:hypothetical protein